MNYWIFQGSPNQFPVREYVVENKIINWSVRQKHFKDQISKGDQVFIWIADGGKRNTGGIIALTEIISNVYEVSQDLKVDLQVKEYRIREDEGMLMRRDLKNIPEFMNQRIIKLAQGTNFLLTKDEFDRVLELWKNPTLVKKRLELSLLEKYLYLYKWEEDERLSHLSYIKDSLEFFHQFKQQTYIEEMEWEDFQKIGEHVNALTMGIARHRALGEMNAPIEKYRESFLYLIHGEDPINERIDNFLTNDKYKLFGIGKSAVSEILGNVFSEEYCFYNQQDKVAVENVLQIDPSYQRGDTYGDKFVKFQQAIKEKGIVEKYESIVGQLTDIPVLLEIDQFFSYLFQHFSQDTAEIIETADNPKYWVLAAGNNKELWNEFQEKAVIAIGWDHLGDLSEYNSKEEIMDELQRYRDAEVQPSNDALANDQFFREMQIGDYVFIKHGSNRILGYGIIAGDYRYDESAERFRSRRDVEWKKVGDWYAGRLPLKTLTEWTGYDDAVQELFSIIHEDNTNDETEEIESEEMIKYTQEHFLAEMFMDEEQAFEIIESLKYKKNIILEGPPGVGKTFAAKRIAYLHMHKKLPEQVEMVQFHQSYSYEDFVQGYKPTTDGFALKNGLFYRFCQKAINNPEKNYYMIIDEINRGNLSKIFGELMMLLEADKRGKEFAVKLAYTEEEETFYIPENLYLIGTMNTADRSLAFVDFALRRRFAFIPLKPAFGTEKFNEFLRNKKISQGLINKINETITYVNNEIINDIVNLGKGFEIGHSYFCPEGDSVQDEEEWFKRIIRLEISPLLHEYWFDQEEKVNELLKQFE